MIKIVSFCLYFDNNTGSRNIEKEVFNTITPYIKQLPKKEQEGVYRLYLKLPSEKDGDYTTLHIYYHLKSVTSIAILSNALTADEASTILYSIMFALAKEMNPLCAFDLRVAGTTTNGESVYYADPYFLVLEPPTEPDAIIEFLADQKIQQKLSEIKKVLPFEELMQIVYKYSIEGVSERILRIMKKYYNEAIIKEILKIAKEYFKPVIMGKNGGAGIIKNDFLLEKGYVYPHYFLRKLVRSRGVELEEGYAEKYAKKLKMEEE